MRRGQVLGDERLRERLREQVADESVVDAAEHADLVARVVERAREHGEGLDLGVVLLRSAREAR